MSAPERQVDVGRYRLLERLAVGGMGEMWRAQRRDSKTLHAIKFATQDVERLTREARALDDLEHPNIIQLHEDCTSASRPHLVLELVDGADCSRLRQGASVQGIPSPRASIRIIVELCKALEHVHERGWVHRDVTPRNVMVKRDGGLRLIDFGLARETHSLSAVKGEFCTLPFFVVGTPGFMAPEQLRDFHSAGPPTDVFGTACLAFYLLEGFAPYPGQPAQNTSDPIAIDRGSPGFRKALAQATASACSERPAIGELGRQLQRELHQFPDTLPPAAQTARGVPTRSMSQAELLPLTPLSQFLDSPSRYLGDVAGFPFTVGSDVLLRLPDGQGVRLGDYRRLHRVPELRRTQLHRLGSGLRLETPFLARQISREGDRAIEKTALEDQPLELSVDSVTYLARKGKQPLLELSVVRANEIGLGGECRLEPGLTEVLRLRIIRTEDESVLATLYVLGS